MKKHTVKKHKHTVKKHKHTVKKHKHTVKKHYTERLSKRDKQKQLSNIKKSRKLYKKGVYINRPKLKSYTKKRSGWVQKFENKYNRKITDTNFIHKNIITRKGQGLILKKGRGAYYSSGSRPNQTASSWAYARLASVIMNGPSRKVDQTIWTKYRV